jgi:hypothetical protein
MSYSKACALEAAHENVIKDTDNFHGRRIESR